MALELRHIDSPEDLERWTRAIVRPFFAPGGIDARIELNQRFFDEGDRRTLAEIDAVIAGTFCSFDTMMSMPGGPDINVNAITGVTVQGTHRRRGVLTKMMLSDLANAHERGQAAAILFSAEYPIYGRFGFGVATRTQSIKVNKHRTGFARPASTDSLAGAVQYCTVDELHAVAPELFEVTRSSRGAEIGRTPVKWELECGVTDWPDEPWKGWQPIAVDRTGAPDGYVRWHVDELWDRGQPSSTLHVDALVATTSAAHERLWRFIFGLDLISFIAMRELAIDDPLPWMLHDARAMIAECDPDGLWLRTLDPVALLRGRALRAGAVDVAINDELGYATCVVRVEADNVKRLRRRTADLTMNVSTFSTLALGTERADVLLRAGLIDEHRNGAATTLSDILAVNAAPMTSTHF